MQALCAEFELALLRMVKDVGFSRCSATVDWNNSLQVGLPAPSSRAPRPAQLAGPYAVLAASVCDRDGTTLPPRNPPNQHDPLPEWTPPTHPVCHRAARSTVRW